MQRNRILVIDDSETILQLVCQILQGDYDVLTAKDGRSGIAMARSERPDLIILDLVMPGMDGLSVCEALRADDATKTTPIMVLTSIADGRNIRVNEQRWWSAYTTKPIDRAELLATVRRCLRAPKAEKNKEMGAPGGPAGASSKRR